MTIEASARLSHGCLTVAGLATSLLARRHVRVTPCDVLLLFTYPAGPARHAHLATALRARGLDVACQVVTRPQVLTDRMLLRPTGCAKGPGLDPWEALAAYLVARHRPRLLVTFLNASALAKPLMRRMEATGGVHVNIAHAVLAPEAMEPFPLSHYLFVFGESSVRACRKVRPQQQAVRLVKTGSLYLDVRHSPPPTPPARRVLFASTWIPKGYESRYLPAFQMVAAWSRARQDFRIDVKPHPLNDAGLIRRFFKGLGNVSVLPRDVTPEAVGRALTPVPLVLSPFSCLSLEAAVASRPSVVVGPENVTDDVLELGRFFQPVSSSVEALDRAVEATLASYDASVEQCQAFAAHHLDRVSGALEYTVECLETIFHGREEFPVLSLAEPVANAAATRLDAS